METLISMTSFVKKVLNEDRPCDRGKMLDEIGNYAEFLSQPLDVEGSNIAYTGRMLSVEDIEIMGADSYKAAINEYNSANSNVYFENIFLDWDQCDCNDGYCSHGSFVVGLDIVNDDKVYRVDFEDGDHLYFEGNNKTVRIPYEGATINDFVRACELCNIKLQLTETAKKQIGL